MPIEITQRKELLKNLGAVQRHDIPDTAAAWRGGEGLGRGLVNLGLALGNIAEREDDKQVAISAAEVMRRNDTRLMSPDKTDDGEMYGLLHRRGEACKDLHNFAGAEYERIVGEVGEEMDLSDHQMEMLRLKLAPYARSCKDRVLMHQAGEYRRLEVANAEALWKYGLETLKSGNNTPEMFTSVLQDYEHYLDVCAVSGEDRFAKIETFCRGAVMEELGAKLDGFQTEEAFDLELEAVRNNPEVELAGKGDMSLILEGHIGNNTAAEMERLITDRRRRFVANKEYERSRAVEKIIGDFQKEEMKIAAADLPRESYPELYERYGQDERLKALSPVTATRYLETAKKMRAAIAKGKCDDNESSLATRMTKLLFAASTGEVDGARIAAEQSALWRDYKTALLAGAISEPFARSFQGRINSMLSDQEVNAMRYLYSRFGYLGDISKDGSVTKADQKSVKGEDFAVPSGYGRDNGEVSAAELFEMGETLLRGLNSLGPNVNREEAMKVIVGEIETDWYKKDFKRNIETLSTALRRVGLNVRSGEIKDERRIRDGRDGRSEDDAGGEGADVRSGDGERDE